MMGSLLVIEGDASALPLPSGARCPTLQFEKRDVVIRGGVGGEDRVYVRDPPYGHAWDDSHRVRIQVHRKEQVTLWQRQDRANEEGSQKSRAGCTAGDLRAREQVAAGAALLVHVQKARHLRIPLRDTHRDDRLCHCR